jgi:hypothetical protein
MPTITKTELFYGAIFALSMLVWISLEFAIGLHTTYIELHPYFSFLFAFVAVVIIYLGVKARRARTEGPFPFMHAFMSGMYISVVVVLLSPATNYIFHTFINPEFFSAMIDMSVRTMKSTQDQAEAYFNLTSYIQQSMVFGLISGLFTSAGVALFLRRK